MDPTEEAIATKGRPIDVSTIAAAGLAAITLYLLGVMCHRLFGLPAPVAMLFLAVLAKLTQRGVAASAERRPSWSTSSSRPR